MKPSEQMKRDFELAVTTRLMELLGEQIEPTAQARFKAILNGHAPTAKAKTFTIKNPPRAILRRGNKAALEHLRPNRLTADMARAAWDALARDGKFAHKAVRSDMTTYLVETFAEQGATRARVSAALSNAIKIGLLTGEV